MDKLLDQVRYVASLRKESESLKSKFQEEKVLWEMSIQDLLDSMQSTTKNLQDAEDQLRYMRMDIYKGTGDKKPIYGTSIRIMSELEYQDELALEWAIEHNVCLKLDEREFRKVAKAMPLSFVKTVEHPQVTIASDLEKVIKESEDDKT